MSLLEFGEAFLWFCVAAVIMSLGMLLAILGFCINYFRGTWGGRTPLVCALGTGVTAVMLWLIVAFADPPMGLIMAAITTVFAILALASWLNRSDRT